MGVPPPPPGLRGGGYEGGLVYKRYVPRQNRGLCITCFILLYAFKFLENEKLGGCQSVINMLGKSKASHEVILCIN